MCEQDDSWTNEVQSNQLASHQTTIRQEVRVLLVHHDKESLVSLANMLEMCSYKVTVAELPSNALEMLANGGDQFDIVMANICSHDLQGFKLLEEAVKRDIAVILMSSANEHDPLARMALERGASLYIKNPTCMEVVECLWQFVAKERLRNKGKNTIADRADSNGKSTHRIEETPAEENNAEEDDGKNKNTGKRKAENKNDLNENATNGDESTKVKSKAARHWSKELHGKFIEVVNQLGDGKCFPKDILQKMNVPGLTRLQVASHLQKCRHDKWRPPRERSDPAAPRQKGNATRYGSIPRSCIINDQQQQQENQENSATLQIKSGLGTTISTNERGESSRTKVSLGFNSSVHNGELKLQNSGIWNRTSIEGIGIGTGKRNANGNRYTIPASTAMEMNVYRPIGSPNLPAFHGAAIVTNSQANLSTARQIDDDFFDFPNLDYLVQNFSGLQQGSRANHAQSQQTYTFEQIFPD